MGKDDDEILKLAEEFIDEELDPDFIKSFTPEESERILGAIKLLQVYEENFPKEILEALKTLAKLAVEDQDQDRDDEDEDEDEDGKKKIKKKDPKWSFSFAKVAPDADEDDDQEILSDSEIEELIKNVADEFETIDDLLKTAAGLGLELAKTKGNKEIEAKIDDLNRMIRRIAVSKGVLKSGDNGDDIWSFSFVKSSEEDEDDE